MNNLHNKLSSFIVVPLVALNALTQPIQPTQEIQPLYWTNPAPIEVIEKYSNEYGVDKNMLYSVLNCESGLNIHAKASDSGKSKGIAQIQDGTWSDLEKSLGEDLDEQSYHDAIKLTAFALSKDKGYLWTAYRAIKNGGSYTFKNAITGKIDTVKCSYAIMK